jgi:hypothetical protein
MKSSPLKAKYARPAFIDSVAAVKDAPNSAFSFSEEEIDIVLGPAAARMLKIT